MMTIYLGFSARSDVGDEYISAFKQLQNQIRTIQLRAQLPRKELKARIVESYLIVGLKSSSFEMSVIKILCLFFVNLRVLVCVMP